MWDDEFKKILDHNPDVEKIKVFVDMILKILKNIVSNPYEEKYRKVKSSSGAFQSKIANCEGYDKVFIELGFVYFESSEQWIIEPSEEKWNTLTNIYQKLSSFQLRMNGQPPAPVVPTSPMDPNFIHLFQQAAERVTSANNTNNSDTTNSDSTNNNS